MYAERYMTVYNLLTDPETDNVTFHRTVMKCHWEQLEGKVATNGTGTGASADVFIPFTAANKTYLIPGEFEKLTAEEAGSYFTFAPEDVMYPFPMADEIEENGLRDFLRNHVGGYRILRAVCNDFGSAHMRHWEVRCEN